VDELDLRKMAPVPRPHGREIPDRMDSSAICYADGVVWDPDAAPGLAGEASPVSRSLGSLCPDRGRVGCVFLVANLTLLIWIRPVAGSSD
jgi:hypothetical protein